MAYVLINARPSPFGRKVAIALMEKAIPFTVQFDVPWAEATCTPEYSPLEQLPILVTDSPDGNVYDSAFILDWLEIRFPEPSLMPADLDQRVAAARRRLLGERLMEVAQSLIFEVHRPQPSTSWIERQTRKVRGVLTELERLYADNLPQTALGLDLGDIAVATTLLGIEFAVASGLSPDVPVLQWRAGCPAVAKRVDVLDTRPSFVATRPALMDVNLQATVA